MPKRAMSNLRRAVMAVICATIFWACGADKQKADTGQTAKVIEQQTPWGLERFVLPEFPDRIIAITEMGADTASANNQKAIQKAIDLCSEKGGGTVSLPAGVWRTSYLELRDNVNLRLEKGSVLSFSDNPDDYAVPTFTRWEGMECMNYHPLLYAKGKKNIAITGKGRIEGNGKAWWHMARKGKKITLPKLYTQALEGVAPKDRNCLEYEEGSFLRPSMIQLINCENILVQGIEIGSGPMWTTHFVYCKNVVAQRLKVRTNGHNNDGLTPDSCEKMLIDDCDFSTGDDCIVIKSGLNEDGWRVGKPSSRIVIRNSKTKRGHGGVVIGSEMSGGVNKVYALNCDFGGTDRGLRVKSMKGRGGVIEDIWFENIQMKNIRREAIMLNMRYGSSSTPPRGDKVPVFRNFNFKNIVSTGSKHAVRVVGLPESNVDGMNFENMRLQSKKGIEVSDISDCVFDSLELKAETPSLIHVKDGNNIAVKRLYGSVPVSEALLISGEKNKDVRIVKD
ncbi:glycoside hydrolase (plasmid) [Fulvitalea axinellae]|uniref:Glycoside hydrolase n=1 Tax=Fulvitalea axinellae TaxID=1182444 RepID=A0AAU9DEZ5_9BACT|nr:glycoside hydrolase [Fulvitalea axinellae]